MLAIFLLAIAVHQAVGQTAYCGGFPRAPANSDLKCFTTSCMATCRDDSRFENGLRMLALTCRNNTWLPWFGGFNYIPDCLPSCKPSCTNGTMCYLPQRQCHCPDGFGGPSCETEITCPANEVHRGCADSCEVTCRARVLGQPCKVNCVEGCTCSAGMARTGKGQCVVLEKCPCPVDDFEIADGFHTMNTTGDRYDICTCSKQQWTCKPLAKGHATVFGEAGNLAMFDGTITKYQAYCGYYLLKMPSHTIIIDGRPTQFDSASQNSSDSPSRFRSLTFHIPWQTVQLLQDKRVIVNSNTISTLPFVSQYSFKIWEASSKFLVATLPNGVEVHWDGDTVANVYVPPILYNQTKGIFGGYNGIKNKLLLTSDGKYTTSMKTFLESWRVDNCSLPVMRARENVACNLESVPDNVHQMCSKIFDQGFSECNEMMEYNNTMNFYIACVTEACACKTDSCTCGVFSEYANLCSNMFALNMTSWFHSVQECVPKCPAGQIYQFCRSSCSRSCKSHEINPKCVTECVEGCNCPEGQSLDSQGICIPTNKCFCMDNGYQYIDGYYRIEKINNTESVRCTCKAGSWECIRESYATCKGTFYMTTFDAKNYFFKGNCSYTLVQHENFFIEAYDPPSSNRSSTGNITIKYNGTKIQLLQKLEVKVDKKLVSLPWEKKDIISIYKAPYKVTVELSNKLNITWDGVSSVYIYMPVTFYGSVKGLCGTFNNNPDDDFEMPSGKLTNNETTFGNSWVVSRSCPGQNPCVKSEQLDNLADSVCSKIQSDAFKSCHNRINYTPTYENCLYDVCASENASSACPHFITYAQDCRQAGILLNWRKNVTECRTTCPAGQVYKLNGDVRTRSCRYIQPNSTCQSYGVEDCFCPEGRTLDDAGNCVDLSTCPCS